MQRTARAMALVAAALALLAAPVTGALCSSVEYQDAYTSLLASTNTCESAVGFTLTETLTKTQTTAICSTCTALAAKTKAQQLPTCNVKDSDDKTVTVLSLYEGYFACTTTSSTAGSKTTDMTPVPSPKTSPTPSPKTTNTTTPSTSPSPSTTPSSSSTTGGSGSDAVTTTTKPSSTTKSPTTTTAKTPSSTSGSSASSKTSGSGSLSQASTQPAATSNSNTVIIVSAAGGIVLLVILIATFIVCRQRHRNRDKRLNEVLLSPVNTTDQRSTIPRGSTARSQTGTGGNRSNASAQSMQMPQGGLWDDEAIVAARIPREKVFTETLLSRGGYGEVYRGVYNDQTVAIKTLLPETRKNMKQINAFLAEVKLMASLEHQCIVSFIGVAWDSLTDLCVVSEYMAGGDLRMVLSQFEKNGRSHGFDHEKVKIALHISHALTYLHSLQPVVLHRDLKSKNILLDQDLNAKLTDFGVSRERSDRTMTAGVGTSLWMAPEVMMGERYDEKSDIFSFGVVLSELDSHVLPYSQVKESESGRRIPDTAVLQMVSLGKLKVEFSSQAHPEVVALANACVAVSARDRPTAADVLYRLHSLLKNF